MKSVLQAYLSLGGLVCRTLIASVHGYVNLLGWFEPDDWHLLEKHLVVRFNKGATLAVPSGAF